MTTVPDRLSNGRYRLVDRLAVGGMGEVWRAVDELLGRDVAIKILRDQYADDEMFRTRFRAEARNTAGLSHPGIARMYDYGEQHNLAYLVMELVDGEPLVEILGRARRLDAEVTLDIVAQTARALQAAHEAGLIHRDIKPGNLIVGPQGTVKVTDFGIARLIDGATMTQTGTVLGTAQYVSPEQAEGRSLTGATDIYSLGIVAYECLAGSVPFVGDSAVAIALAQVRDQPPALPQDVPAGVRELVMSCLAKDPGQRPADAGELSATAHAAAAHAAAGLLRGSPPEAGARAAYGEHDEAGGAAQAAERGDGGRADAFPAPAGPEPETERHAEVADTPPYGVDAVSTGTGPARETPAVAATGSGAGPAGPRRLLGRRPERRHVLVMAGAMGLAVVSAGGLMLGVRWPTLFQEASSGPPLVVTESRSTSPVHSVVPSDWYRSTAKPVASAGPAGDPDRSPATVEANDTASGEPGTESSAPGTPTPTGTETGSGGTGTPTRTPTTPTPTSTSPTPSPDAEPTDPSPSPSSGVSTSP